MSPVNPPWEVGQVLMFATFDHELGDLRDLDGTQAVVVESCGTEWVTVDSQYGILDEIDPYCFMVPR